MEYQSMSPMANKLLNSDGSVSTFTGDIILPPDERRAALYASMHPAANKLLNPDGTISTIQDVISGGTYIHNELQGRDTANAHPMGAVSGLVDNIQDLHARVIAVGGDGGRAYKGNLGTATPTQQQLTQAAMQGIWGDDAGKHAASEIFNGTVVLNTYTELPQIWKLANTPDTVPSIFLWEDWGVLNIDVAGYTRAFYCATLEEALQRSAADPNPDNQYYTLEDV